MVLSGLKLVYRQGELYGKSGAGQAAPHLCACSTIKEGLSGKADFTDKVAININELDLYAVEEDRKRVRKE